MKYAHQLPYPTINNVKTISLNLFERRQSIKLWLALGVGIRSGEPSPPVNVSIIPPIAVPWDGAIGGDGIGLHLDLTASQATLYTFNSASFGLACTTLHQNHRILLRTFPSTRRPLLESTQPKYLLALNRDSRMIVENFSMFSPLI